MHKREVTIGSRTLSIETGKLAKQADGSVVVRSGDTMVIVTACHAASPREGIDFLPLTVDYREYTYAAGRIPGGFFKREGRATEKETITARLIDRPLRPLFPPGYTNETQVIALVLSADGENDPDILAINGASTALVLSEIPFYNPIGAVRVGLIDGQVIFNPTNSQRDVADLDLVVVASQDAVVMVEAGANQLSEQKLLDCIWAGLPIVCTRGDVLSELVEQRGLGLTVPEGDVDAVVAALRRLLDDREFYAGCVANLRALKNQIAERISSLAHQIVPDEFNFLQQLSPGAATQAPLRRDSTIISPMVGRNRSVAESIAGSQRQIVSSGV